MSLRPFLVLALSSTLLAACGPSGKPLAHYPDLQVDIGTLADPSSGAVSLRLRLSTPWTEGVGRQPTTFATTPSTAECVVLGADVRATFDGQPMNVESLGATQSSPLGGDACDDPVFSLPLPPPATAGRAPATFVVSDGSKTITVVVPDLFAQRTLSLASGGTVHPGDTIEVAWDDADDDLSYLDDRTPIARCDDGAVISLAEGDATRCLDAAWLQNGQLEVTLPPSTPAGPATLTWAVHPSTPPDGPMAKVSVCDGAARCRATVPYPPAPLEITVSP